MAAAVNANHPAKVPAKHHAQWATKNVPAKINKTYDTYL